MINFIIGLIIGAIIMDFAWAYKLGIAQRFWSIIKARFSKQ